MGGSPSKEKSPEEIAKEEREKLDKKQSLFDKLLVALRLKNNELEEKQSVLERTIELNAAQQEQKLREMQAHHDEVTRQIQEQHKLALETYKEVSRAELDELKKLLERKNYESFYAMPPHIKYHKMEHPKAFNIQVLGTRGVGKSTFINHLLRELGISLRAATGQTETTVQTQFFDLTQKVVCFGPYQEIFVVDQPGMGGQKITEASYLHKFGPGHFDITLLFTNNGFNENEVKLLRHLVHNKCQLIIVRTFCGVAVDALVGDAEDEGEDLSEEEAFVQLKTTFQSYMYETLKTMNATDVLKNPILYFGRKRKNYPDFADIVTRIKSGGLIKQAMPELCDINLRDEILGESSLTFVKPPTYKSALINKQ